MKKLPESEQEIMMIIWNMRNLSVDFKLKKN